MHDVFFWLFPFGQIGVVFNQMLANCRFIPFKLMQLFKTLKFARKTLQYYFNEGLVFHCELQLCID